MRMDRAGWRVDLESHFWLSRQSSAVWVWMALSPLTVCHPLLLDLHPSVHYCWSVWPHVWITARRCTVHPVSSAPEGWSSPLPSRGKKKEYGGLDDVDWLRSQHQANHPPTMHCTLCHLHLHTVPLKVVRFLKIGTKLSSFNVTGRGCIVPILTGDGAIPIQRSSFEGQYGFPILNY